MRKSYTAGLCLLAIVAVMFVALRHRAHTADAAAPATPVTRPVEPARTEVSTASGGPPAAATNTPGVPVTPTPLPSPGSAAGPVPAGGPGTREAADPVAALPVLALREEPLSGSDGLRRLRLVKADFKHPYWRVEETFTRNAAGALQLKDRRIAVADHALVQLRDDAPAGAVDEIARRHGLTLRKASIKAGLYLLAAPRADLDTLPELLRTLSQEPLVRFAEPDHIVSAQATVPNDPSFGQLWGLRNTGQTGGTPGADIDAAAAWDWTTGNTGVVVGVIDSGVDYDHADLAANIWSNPLEVVNGLDDDGNGFIDDIRGWDFYDEDAAPLDENSHGTHVAGTIAAVGNNGVGIAGVNWRCRIVPLRFLNASGNGTTADAVEAILYASLLRRNGVDIRITNNSWGGSGSDVSLREAIEANAAAGLLFVAAAGNSSWNNDVTPFYPASYSTPNIVSVAATDHNDALASFSHYGLVTVDLAAPGVNIYSTIPGGYGSKQGTSMAAPHVTGVAALLAGLSPSADWPAIREAIMKGVDPLPSLAGRTVTGGRLNAFKAIQALAWIDHTPLADTYETNSPYAVEALIVPGSAFATNAIQLFWNTDGSTDTFTSASFTPIGNERWRAWIPAHPLYTEIRYWIGATTAYGFTLLSPSNAPQAMHSFRVLPPLAFIVSGTPGEYGATDPDYGWYVRPSGTVVTAQATPFTEPGDLARWRCSGWQGMGSVPASGTTNTLVFTLERASALGWQWARQYALQQTSSVPGLLSSTTWWEESATAATLTAPATIGLQGTNFAFAYWTLDGSRQPGASNVAVNPVTGVLMSTGHLAQAVYRPENEDLDSDGMADWWELYHFGDTGLEPGADADGDGVPNVNEFLDRSDPTASNSIPAPPVIFHTPLADPQAAPAPYPIAAVVTDNHAVAAVTLFWTRNGGSTLSTNMTTSGTGTLYQAAIAAPGAHGDTFAYSIVASDPVGHVVTSGPHFFNVDYPVLVVTPSSIGPVWLEPGLSESHTLTISNAGSADLTALLSFDAGGLSNDVEQGVNGWTHSGTGDLWNVASLRWTSPSNAWYAGNPATALYTSLMHAHLESPPLFVAPGALLTFQHWLACELDKNPGRTGHSWDGGIVEISTNGGAAFTQIAPVGGYPYLISGWGRVGEAWPEGTPCFAGTGGWQQATFDLSNYAGQWVILRWHFGSDGNTEFEGWYIDDVVVAPPVTTNDWLTFDPTNLLVARDSSATVTVTVSSVNVPTGDRAALLRVQNNSPADPEAAVPVFLSVRSPPGVEMLTAAQVSTAGEGLVALSNAVHDIDGDVCAVEYLWSTNAGVDWQTCWVAGATSTAGTVLSTRMGLPQVTAVPTRNGTTLITNTVVAVWDTTTLAAGIDMATGALVRCRAWDGRFWSPPCTSQPFLVDNAAPTAPTYLESPSHPLGAWDTNRSIVLAWTAASDTGGGVAGYRYGVQTDLGILELTAETTATSVTSAPVADGTNWQAAVQAFDAFGNTSPAIVLGPFWIDATPPAATGAVITLARSAYGPYVLGTAVTGAWTGFTDSASGVNGYFVSFTDGGATTNGLWVTAPPATLTDADPDATNRVYVWARDAAGLIGPAASAPLLVLSAGGDWDGDGASNEQEEVAGTDAQDAQSALRLHGLTAPDATGTVFVLRWQGITNRFYSLSHRAGLQPSDPDWADVGDFLQVPGVDGFMSYTDRHGAVTRFYRLSVEQP